ncbi:MAG: Mov34/MPN/PAD-1 family protein [Ardenticatenaceae bacterium]|nr:Mov34/MPN/PAD-1 family protein [Ardenticatenaceae bacterium]MCB8988411.1 Mov34/MPN/PAD-1 family protein [Ardenticatenaceae bacterium]
MNDKPVYAAIVTIKVPQSGQSASVTVVLTPPDTVTVDGRVKPLADCTLRDLQAFADELEADVWDAYEAITLLELDEQQKAEIEVTVLDRQGKTRSLENIWQRQAIILPAESEAEETAVAVADESTADEEESTDQETAVPDPPELAPQPEPEPESPPEAEPQVVVAESEPVFAEPEETAVAGPEAAIIAPSKARVQIAGRRLPVGSRTWMAVDILMEEPAFRAAQAHALSSPNREVAGVLVGPRPEKQPDGRYVVHIMDTIIAKYTVMQGASVTYTPESWRYMNDKLNERYPDDTAVMVGWYHTHPGFGIFLSGMDQFIHQNFFTQIWHVALVLDPQARISGFFCWDRQKTRVSPVEFEWPGWAARSW